MPELHTSRDESSRPERAVTEEYRRGRAQLDRLLDDIQDVKERLRELGVEPTERPRTSTPPAGPRANPPRPGSPASRGSQKLPLTEEPRYPVGLYRIVEVPEMTETEAERLRDFGINLTDELLHTDLDRLAASTGFAPSKLQRWRDMCELMALSGIGPQRARRLVDAGITSIQQLAKVEPGDLVERLLGTLEQEGVGEKQEELMRRTLPAWAQRVSEKARKAAETL